MRPKTFRFIVTSSIVAKILCLCLLLPLVAPVIRPALVVIFATAIGVQCWVLWRYRERRPAPKDRNLSRP